MPGPPVVPFHGDSKLPDHTDCVVIGGGIIGTSTALELAEAGLRVVLCEKGSIGHEQSSRNWGWVRLSLRDTREIPLMVESLRIWSRLAERTGRDVGFQRAGIVSFCRNGKEQAMFERWAGRVSDYADVESRMVGARQLASLFPDAHPGAREALFTPTDGRAEPQKAAPAIAEAARVHGAAVLTSCAVRGIETSAGAISGVITERGPIACKAVVLAGGAWSNLFCRRFGIDLPQLKVVNSVLRTAPLEAGPRQAVLGEDFSCRKRQDGGYTMTAGLDNQVDIVPDSFRYAWAFLPAWRMEWRSTRFRLGRRFLVEASMPKRWRMDETSPFEQCRVLDPKPFSDKAAAKAIANAARVFPALANARIAQRWAGCIDATPDVIPVISAVAAIPGFHIATGFSGHGFGIGPAAGRLMADVVLNRVPIVDPQPFRFARFSDGSRVRPEFGV